MHVCRGNTTSMESLDDTIHTALGGHRVYWKAEERWLNWVYEYLYGCSFLEAWVRWEMWTYSCCAEMVVHRNAIRNLPQAVYRRLLKQINKYPDAPWAWVMERTWQNLFTRPR